MNSNRLFRYVAPTQHCGHPELFDANPDSHSVAIIDQRRFLRECLIHALRKFATEKWDMQSFPTLADAIAAKSDKALLAVVYVPQDLRQTLDAIIAVANCNNVDLLIISDQSNAELTSVAKRAIQSGARGLLSASDAGPQMLCAAIDLVINGGTFISRAFLLEPSEPAKSASKSILTLRQTQVFLRLKEGKPNKIIAHELGMSESTTKVHVRTIMTKLGVTNRTQAAFVGGAQF